jgi:hypothetical protein
MLAQRKTVLKDRRVGEACYFATLTRIRLVGLVLVPRGDVQGGPGGAEGTHEIALHPLASKSSPADSSRQTTYSMILRCSLLTAEMYPRISF